MREKRGQRGSTEKSIVDLWAREAIPRWTVFSCVAAGASLLDISIHPEADIHYTHHPTPSDRTLKIYQQNEGKNIDSMPVRMPMLNAGVFAMRAGSRVWKMWLAELLQLKIRHEGGESIYFSDQIPLHKLIYRQGIKYAPLRAIDNWMAVLCMPMLHLPTQCLRSPTPPHEALGILHLAGRNIKNQVFRIGEHSTTLQYRDISRLYEA